MNCRLSVPRRTDPVEDCLDIPRFNCSATFSMIFDIESYSYVPDQLRIKQNIVAFSGNFVKLVLKLKKANKGFRQNERDVYFFCLFQVFLISFFNRGSSMD